MKEAKPMRIRAALSRDGVEVYGDHVNMNPDESRTILLQVREVLTGQIAKKVDWSILLVN